MTRLDELYTAGQVKYPPHIRYTDMGDVNLNGPQLEAFVNGALYADSHLRKGLWDAEKVINYIYHYAHVRTFGDIVIDNMSVTEFIERMKKAMEEQ